MFGVPTRGGTRGGRNQFSWEAVKADKYKDFYLGHSLHTSQKPTFNNPHPNPLWWVAKSNTTATPVQEDEIARVKEEEERLLKEALGLAPKRAHTSRKKLDPTEIAQLTKRGELNRDIYETERVAGLGYAPAPVVEQKEDTTAPRTLPSETTATAQTQEGKEAAQPATETAPPASPTDHTLSKKRKREEDEGEIEHRKQQAPHSDTETRERKRHKHKHKHKHKHHKEKSKHKHKHRRTASRSRSPSP